METRIYIAFLLLVLNEMSYFVHMGQYIIQLFSNIFNTWLKIFLTRNSNKGCIDQNPIKYQESAFHFSLASKQFHVT